MPTFDELIETGLAHHDAGRLDLAEQVYRQVLSADPRNARAMYQIGLLSFHQGNPAEAVRWIEEALRHAPHQFVLHVAVGEIFHELGRYTEAEASQRRAIAMQPAFPLAHFHLGMALDDQQRYLEACAAYQETVRLDPANWAALNNWGVALSNMAEYELAELRFREALALNPQLLEGHLSLAGTLLRLNRPDDAAEACQRALAIDPKVTVAHSRLGIARVEQGNATGAIASYRRALELDPTVAEVHSNLIYTMNFDPAYDTATLFAAHQAWAVRHAEPLTALAAPHDNDRSIDRRLRVGYFSPHFHRHAVSVFSEPIIASHDRSQVEVYCYYDSPRVDEATDRFRAISDHWRSVHGVAEEQVARQMREDRIDILVDLAGHIGANRLRIFARRPAPVQVTYLGYQNTTGMLAMDYRLTDVHSDPPGETDAFYTERLVRLPRSFFCYSPELPSPMVNELPAAAGRPFTFAAVNAVQKTRPEAVAAWGRILAAVPGSRLLLLGNPGGAFERTIRQWLCEHGVVGDRIEVLDRRPRYEFLQIFQRADLALDSFPFNGHTTVCDALWMGVPSVMLKGQSYATRFGSSAAVSLGLTDWIAESADQYVEIAVRAASNLAGLAKLRRELRQRLQQSPLMDAVGFARNLEAAYRGMWQAWCQGSMPQSKAK